MIGARNASMALILIGLAGVAISAYLTLVHYAPVPLVCSSNGVVNCERVLTSPYSSVGGIPISVGGLLWFAVIGVTGVFGLANPTEPRGLQPFQVLWSLVGLASVLYLVGVEVLALGVLCIWCTTLHFLILAAVFISILRSPARTALT